MRPFSNLQLELDKSGESAEAEEHFNYRFGGEE
jgi:hypothetical protein